MRHLEHRGRDRRPLRHQRLLGRRARIARQQHAEIAVHQLGDQRVLVVRIFAAESPAPAGSTPTAPRRRRDPPTRRRSAPAPAPRRLPRAAPGGAGRVGCRRRRLPRRLDAVTRLPPPPAPPCGRHPDASAPRGRASGPRTASPPQAVPAAPARSTRRRPAPAAPPASGSKFRPPAPHPETTHAAAHPAAPAPPPTPAPPPPPPRINPGPEPSVAQSRSTCRTAGASPSFAPPPARRPNASHHPAPLTNPPTPPAATAPPRSPRTLPPPAPHQIHPR